MSKISLEKERKQVMRKIFLIIFLFILFFALYFGFIVLSVFVHESIHKFDFRNIIVKGTDHMCILNCGEYTGYYSFTPINESNAEKIRIFSERKAYFFGFVIIIIGAVISIELVIYLYGKLNAIS
jgi:hypothetical protein